MPSDRDNDPLFSSLIIIFISLRLFGCPLLILEQRAVLSGPRAKFDEFDGQWSLHQAAKVFNVHLINRVGKNADLPNKRNLSGPTMRPSHSDPGCKN
eukprot:1225332-Amorphochlora_amoeboformis.AAC.2